jgi:hypothetical protein
MTGTCVLLTETFFCSNLGGPNRVEPRFWFLILFVDQTKILNKKKLSKQEKFEPVFTSDRQKLSLMLILKVFYILKKYLVNPLKIHEQLS